MTRDAANRLRQWSETLRLDAFDSSLLKEFRHEWSGVVDSFTEEERITMEITARLTPEAVSRLLDECDSPEEVLHTARELAAGSRGCACTGEAPPEPSPAEIEEAFALRIKRAVTPALWMISLRFGSSAGAA